jgi:hypothetical protein
MPKRDTDRERRIMEVIVVDAYGAEERAMSWYYYLDDQLRFPFTATCIAKRSILPPFADFNGCSSPHENATSTSRTHP